MGVNWNEIHTEKKYTQSEKRTENKFAQLAQQSHRICVQSTTITEVSAEKKTKKLNEIWKKMAIFSFHFAVFVWSMRSNSHTPWIRISYTLSLKNKFKTTKISNRIFFRNLFYSCSYSSLFFPIFYLSFFPLICMLS